MRVDLPSPLESGSSVEFEVDWNFRVPDQGRGSKEEVADGWLAQVLVPESAQVAFEHLAKGAARAGRSLESLDVVATVPLDTSGDEAAALAAGKKTLAFTLGAMGSAQKNFYVDAYARAGFGDIVRQVQTTWLAGERDKAVAAVPEDLVEKTRLFGSERMISDRIRAYEAAGVTPLRVVPQGATLRERVHALEQIVDLARLPRS